MPLETRIFLPLTALAISATDPQVMKQLLGLDSDAAATQCAAQLEADSVETREDIYLALPRPYGYCVGLKGRGGKNKVEVKIISNVVPSSSATGGSTRLDEWEKHKVKIDGGVSNVTEVASWLKKKVHHPLAEWAALQLHDNSSIISVPVVKSRRGCSLPLGNTFLEQTDVTILLGSQKLEYRSWAVEGSSESAFLSSVAANWETRMQSLIATTRGLVVDGYPGLVTSLAFVTPKADN